MRYKRYSAMWAISLLMLAAILLVVSLAAQEVTAAINGAVTDPSGAAIAGAQVIATDVDRGSKFSATTGIGGNYSLPRLPVGRYEVRVENAGFQTAIKKDVTLVLNQVAELNFQLQIGNVGQTVEVTSAAPLLQTEQTQVNTVMETNAILAIPLQSRNYQQLALLTPGAVTTSPASFNGGQTTFNSGRPDINGNREQANYYLLDGMDNNEFVDNNVAYSPNVDAINEFNVITNNPNAEFGQFLGGVISVSMKSGTNHLHGSAFEFLRNDKMNANEWSNNFTVQPNGQAIPRQPMRWNEFGAAVGGPIKKDKLFFFADYQGSRFDYPTTVTQIAAFTPQQKNLDFSDLGASLVYPGTSVTMPGNLNNARHCATAQQMMQNTANAPCIYISPVAQQLLTALPTATITGTSNALNARRQYTNGDQGDFKVDWNASEKDHFTARYSEMKQIQVTSNSQAVLYSNGGGANGNGDFPVFNGVVNYTRTISPSMMNEARFGVNYYPAEGNLQAVTGQNLGKLIPGEPLNYLPGLYFAGASIGGGAGSPAYGTVDAPEIFHQTTGQFDDTLIWMHGPHTVHAGFQVLRYRNDFNPATSNDGGAGQIGFSGSYTGNAEVDFIAGLPAYMGIGGTAGGGSFLSTVGQRNSAFGAFVQDDWKITPKLTLNLGLRWQLFTPIYEVHDRMTNFQEYTGAIQLAGQNGASRAMYNQYNGIANFLPRIGLAWTPWGNNTVIRAGFSRSSFQEGTGEYNRLTTNAPWNLDYAVNMGPTTTGGIPANQIMLDQGFSALNGAVAPCTTQNVLSAPAQCFAGVRLHLTDPNYRPAVSNQWNIAVQHQFGNATTVQAAYVGEHTDHMADIVDAGQNFIFSTNPLTVGTTAYLAGNSALLQDKTGQVRLNQSAAIQNYDALQLTVQQRLSHGLDLRLNYTWSKCLTNNQGYYGRYGDAGASQASNDVSFQLYAYNMALDYGLCDRDVTNVFNGYLTYELPFGHSRTFGKTASKAVNAVAGDWRVSAAFNVHGGFPISMLYYGNDPSGAYFQPRPDCVAPSRQTPYHQAPLNPAAGIVGGYLWFDPSTMAAPPSNRFGTCGVSTERGPGLKQVDIGLSKLFPITEAKNVEFRVEAINAFNTPIFALGGYSVDIFGGAGEGVVNTSVGARNVQLSLKFHF
ncbi:MAG TPA: TonB-dependent receptor [Bryobacteraceae bacterium]|nr:TonB-dependent receptor [Bryobacteraceae bacterium]